MPEEYNLQPTPTLEPARQQQKNEKIKLLLLGGIPLLFVIFFVGLLLGRLSTPNSKSASVSAVTPSPTTITANTSQITPTPTNISEVPTIQFLPNKQYFDDTYVIISKDSPHQSLILSVARIEQERSFSEYTKVNYFDGKSWDRKTAMTINPSRSVAINTLLRGWNAPTILTSSQQPPQLATVQLTDQTLSFGSTDLQNEISVQSTPGLTKFIYQGGGTLTIGSEIHPAYVFYSRTYSFNAPDLAYVAQPANLISDSMLFWDKEGTFYYLDSHRPVSSDPAISAFKLGIQEDSKRSVIKTTDLTEELTVNNTVKSYHATLNSALAQEILLPLHE